MNDTILKTCTPFLFHYWVIFYILIYILLQSPFTGSWCCLLISICFHIWEEANPHLSENPMGRGPRESGVSEQVHATVRSLTWCYSSYKYTFLCVVLWDTAYGGPPRHTPCRILPQHANQ